MAGVVWQVHLLGRVQAVAAHTQIDRWPTRAVSCLLARLALEPQRAHAREELVELLWPGRDPGSGRAGLRQALSQLRRLLEPAGEAQPAVLLADRLTVRLAPGVVVCDVHRFEDLLARNAFVAARAVYVGDLMPGHYDNWVQTERLRLRGLFDGLRQRQDMAARADALTAAAAGVATRSAVPPATAPSSAAALTLGTVPSYWTRAYGRQSELLRLQGLVQQHRLVTLLGPGGSGKTRLASALLHGLLGVQVSPACAPWQGQTFERVLFVSLDSCRDLAALQQALRQTLQPVWPPQRLRRGEAEREAPASDRLAEVLGAQPMLAVLDNVEQLLPEAEQAIEDWLRAAPTLHVLLTSRRRLGLDGEQVFELPALPLPATETSVEQAALNPAVALFVDRAQAAHPGFRLTVANVPSVLALNHVLGGMPLAIELAASRARLLHPEELLQRLLAGAGSPLLDLLARPGAGPGASPGEPGGMRSRHASMRHVVDWSWQQLRPEVALLMAALSVLSCPASADMAAQLLAALQATETPAARPANTAVLPEQVSPAQAQALLGEALESSLLQTLPGDDRAPTQYRLLPPVREFGREQCTPDQARRVRQRLRVWLAQCLKQSAGPLPAGQLAQVAELVLTAPGDAALDAALALAVSLGNRWLSAPPSPPVQQVLLQALEGAGDAALRAQGHRLMSMLALNAGQVDVALRQAEQASRHAPDANERAKALVARAFAWLYQDGSAEQAETWLQQALHEAETSGEVPTQVSVLRALAFVTLNHRQDYTRAEPLMRRSLVLCAQIGDQSAWRACQLDLAACLGWTGREDEALALLDQVAQAAHEATEPGVELPALVQIGRVQLRLRAWQAAESALRRAALQARTHHHHAFEHWALLHLPAAWVMTGRAEAAALLQGYALRAWLRDFGAVNGIEARELRRARRLMGLALGTARVQVLLRAGAELDSSLARALLQRTLPAPEEAGR